MNILHIIESMNPVSGGPCQGIRYINSETVQHGTTREVVCLDDPSSTYLGMDPFPVHALGPTKSKWHYTPKLKTWLDNNISRFDVVIVNGLWVYSSFAGYQAIKRLKKIKLQRPEENIHVPNFFVMPHGMLDPYFQKAKTRRLKALRNIFYWFFIENRVVNSADGLLFTSKTELLLARETFFNYKPHKEVNVGYGIYPPPSYSNRMKEAFLEICPGVASKPYLLFLSRIHEKKGLDLLIESLGSILRNNLIEKERIPDLVIAGPGLNSGFGKRIQALVNLYPELEGLVHFVGMIDGDRKWGAIYGCEAFVLPSHQENFGIAVVEAMACKKAVLISNQVNIWLDIIEGGGGLVVPDTFDATKKMLLQWLMFSKEDKKQICANAYYIFDSLFNIKITSQIFLRALNSSISTMG